MRPIPTLLLATLLACSSPRPSPEYERALATWNELLRENPETAAEDPRSDEVLQGLGRVPARSADATAAATLRARIESERRERASERARREEVLRRAALPPSPPVPVPEPIASENARSAGTAGGAPGIVVGLRAEAFRGQYGGCFAPAGEVAVTPATGPAQPGEIWALKDDVPCRQAHPTFVDQVVVVAGGAVAGVRPARDVKRYEIRQEAELATLPDGRPAMVVDGKLVPLPPNARVVREGGGTAP